MAKMCLDAKRLKTVEKERDMAVEEVKTLKVQLEAAEEAKRMAEEGRKAAEEKADDLDRRLMEMTGRLNRLTIKYNDAIKALEGHEKVWRTAM